MKRVSFWALHHKGWARILIVISYFFLNFIGLICGDLLYSINIQLTPPFFYITTSVVLFTFLIYPGRKTNKQYKKIYIRQKISDVLLLTATFLFIVYSSNSYNYGRSLNPLNSAFGSLIIPVVSNKDNDHLLKYNKSQLSKNVNKKQLRSLIKSVRKKYKDSTKTEKTIYIILAILAAFGAILLIGALSCNIACAGSEALAYIILLLGIGGVIFGLVKLIQSIKRGPTQKKKPVQITEK